MVLLEKNSVWVSLTLTNSCESDQQSDAPLRAALWYFLRAWDHGARLEQLLALGTGIALSKVWSSTTGRAKASRIG